MHARVKIISAAIVSLDLAIAMPAAGSPFFFSAGNPDGRIATASRPGSAGIFEIESADDFDLTNPTRLTSATFTGLLPAGATVRDVVVEIYRVFPKDSNTGRTSGPPIFSTSQVPTRVNSPSDVEFTSRESVSGTLTFTSTLLSRSFTTLNSVQPGGIHPLPSQTTGGDGSVTGEEVQFNIDFADPLSLPADHYFFVPEVQLDTGDFLWLSASKPIAPPGTSFPAGVADLQSWTRDEFLDPDWLRVGTDIVGGPTPPTFNAAFSLIGTPIPEPASLMLLGIGLAGLAVLRRRRP